MADKKKPEAKVAEPVEEPKAPEVVEVGVPEGKTIDERMADLEADLKKMGAH